MKVLLVPANTTDSQHTDLAVKIIQAHGDTVVRWSDRLASDDFDAIVFIPGYIENNREILDALYQEWQEDKDIDMSDVAENTVENIIIGKGIYAITDKFRNKLMAFMVYPDLDDISNRSREDYFNNFDDKAPCFVFVDWGDFDSNLEEDDYHRYAKIDITVITDSKGYKYYRFSEKVVKHITGKTVDVEDVELDNVQTISGTINAASSATFNTMSSAHVSSGSSVPNINLLLLRRRRL